MNFLHETLFRLPVTAVLSIVGAVFAFAATKAVETWWHRRLRRKLLHAAQEYEAERGAREVALIISAVTDIQEAALGHLERTGRGKIPIFAVHQAEGFHDAEEQWFAYLEKLKAEVRRIKESGATRVLLFASVPVALATFVGAMLTNGPEVIVHHHSNGTYFPVGRLTVETVRL